MHIKRVLALLALLVGLAHCFLWDIVVSNIGEKQLYFYYNGILTHMEEIPLINEITSVTYDPVHYRMLLSSYNNQSFSILSFDLSSRTIESLFTKTPAEHDVYIYVYDPVTQLLVWKEDHYKICTFSLNPASSNKAGDAHHIITLYYPCFGVVVDSCGGYIYWISEKQIERARLDGSEREIVCLVDPDVTFQYRLAIDQQTQRIYWIERKLVNGDYQEFIVSSDFNGKNKTTVYSAKKGSLVNSCAISKDFIYWQLDDEMGTWQLPKNSSDHVAKKLDTIYSLNDRAYRRQLIEVNYSIQEQIQGIKSCEALQSLIPKNSKSESTVPICQNYCLEGDCSVNAEGRPTCSCKAGYSGKRCKINACYKHCLHHGVCSLNEEDEPVCQCTAGYDGERCETFIRSDASNSGERNVSACYQYCLHNGVCSLNEQDEPVCQCTADYEGERCEVSVNKDVYCKAACSVNAEGQPTVSVTLGNGVKSTC